MMPQRVRPRESTYLLGFCRLGRSTAAKDRALKALTFTTEDQGCAPIDQGAARSPKQRGAVPPSGEKKTGNTGLTFWSAAPQCPARRSSPFSAQSSAGWAWRRAAGEARTVSCALPLRSIASAWSVSLQAARGTHPLRRPAAAAAAAKRPS